MPVTSTIEGFLKTLRKSALVEEQVIQERLQHWQEADSLPDEPKQLALLFVREALLSKLQAQQLLLGKHRGYVINGKYKVLELLGIGAMGHVFLCEHTLMHRLVAVKALTPGKAGPGTSAMERFYREARAGASLNHPNIVRALDIDYDGKQHYIVMEYVDGCSLHEVIHSHGYLDYTRAAHYIAQAAAGLQNAFEMGWIHRDIKPGNLMLDRQGVVRILDMGLARFYHDKADMLTKKYDENNVLGTADFLAPEQAMDCHEVDTRADIYSLGATFYYLLTGQPPFPDGTVAQKLMAHQLQQPAPISQYRDDVPEDLQGIVETMLAKSPDDRYQQPIEVIAALSPWTETPIDVPPLAEMPKLSPLIAKMQQTSGPGVAMSLSLSSMNLGRFGEGSSPSRSSGFPRPEPSSKSDSLRATLGSTSNRTGPLSATRPRPAPAPEPVPEPQEEVVDEAAAENEAVEQAPGIDRQRLLIGVGVAGAVLFVCTFLGVLGVILLR